VWQKLIHLCRIDRLTLLARKQLGIGAVVAGVIAVLLLWQCGWLKSVLCWLAGWLIPAGLLFVGGLMDRRETTRVEQFDRDGRRQGYVEMPTGRIIPGSVGAGKFMAGAWLVLYAAYWLFYGWWN
jgi:hypothetical protein